MIQNINKDAILIKIAGFYSIFIAIILIILKLVAWFLSNSLGLLSTLVDSLLDLLISLINTVAIYYSLQPADSNHRFGHSAIEDIAGLFQATGINLASLFLIYHAIDRLIYPEDIVNINFSIIIIIISFFLVLSLVILQLYTVKRTKSVIIRADSIHYISDILMYIILFISFILYSKYKILYLDSIFTIIVALYIIYSSYKISKASFDNLMSRELPKTEQRKILDMILNHNGILGYHLLKTRKSGNKVFIQFHVELDRKLNFEIAHNITEELENKILAVFINAEIIIHQDPV